MRPPELQTPTAWISEIDCPWRGDRSGRGCNISLLASCFNPRTPQNLVSAPLWLRSCAAVRSSGRRGGRKSYGADRETEDGLLRGALSALRGSSQGSC